MFKKEEHLQTGRMKMLKLTNYKPNYEATNIVYFLHFQKLKQDNWRYVSEMLQRFKTKGVLAKIMNWFSLLIEERLIDIFNNGNL